MADWRDYRAEENRRRAEAIEGSAGGFGTALSNVLAPEITANEAEIMRRQAELEPISEAQAQILGGEVPPEDVQTQEKRKALNIPLSVPAGELARRKETAAPATPAQQGFAQKLGVTIRTQGDWNAMMEYIREQNRIEVAREAGKSRETVANIRAEAPGKTGKSARDILAGEERDANSKVRLLLGKQGRQVKDEDMIPRVNRTMFERRPDEYKEVYPVSYDVLQALRQAGEKGGQAAIINLAKKMKAQLAAEEQNEDPNDLLRANSILSSVETKGNYWFTPGKTGL